METKVADPLHGALIGGRYRILGRLAVGSVATVYQAHDERLDRIVAVKIIHHERAHDPGLLGRLTDEAKTVAQLAHPNIVAVYDQGTHDDAAYLVMEFVKGRTLREVLNDRGRLAPAEALALLEQVLAALAVGHRAGLVHRDVKPENILVSPAPNGSGDLVDAVVKVADFGLAHAVGATSRHGGLTAAAEYVAPELVADNLADARTDIYSAGIVAFEMLTGRVPFEGGSPTEIAWRHVEHDVPAPSLVVPGLPGPLDALVLLATKRDPADRPRDAAAMLTAVHATRDELAPRAGLGAGTGRAMAAPTVVVSTVHRNADPRPPWARLPEPRNPMLGRSSPIVVAGRRMIERVPTQQVVSAWVSMLAYVDRSRATPQGRRKLIAVVVVVALLIMAGLWWVAFGRYVSAPALTALSRQGALTEASRLGFRVSYGPGRFSEQTPVDTVLDQRPSAGGRIVRGGTITLTLSLGPEQYAVPEVVGQAADFASTQLREHFLVKTSKGFSDTLPVNYVVGTDPPAGTLLKPNTTVTIILAQGPFPLHVPSVVGQQLAGAESQLRGLGFGVEVQRRDDETKPRDTILEQTPPGGQGVTSASGITVMLVVANGPPGVFMPNLKDIACNEAKAKLEAMGLQVNVQGVPYWWVKEQHPEAGAEVQPGQQVTIRCWV